MKKLVKTVAFSSLFASSLFSLTANAGVIGVFGNSSSQAISIANNQGHTAELISDYSNLSNYDVIWGLNGSNSGHSSQLSTYATDIENYVMSGGVFMYHDRYVSNTNNVLPGADNFTFTRNLSTNIDLAQANGVAGAVITDSTLDGGNSSSHGYVAESSIDRAYTAIFDDGNDGNLVDFSFELGLGDIYYSSIPLDYYLSGSRAFATIYAPQVINYVVSLAEENTGNAPAVVSEPATIAVFSLGLFGLAARRFKSHA